MKLITTLGICMTLALTNTGIADESMELNVIPRPGRVRTTGEGYELKPDTAIVVTEDARGVGDYLASILAPATGYTLPVRSDSDSATGAIRLTLDAYADALGDEGYLLSAGPGGVEIGARTPAGLFYGCQTLRQLLPAQIDSPTVVEGVPWRVPGVAIQDAPRFAWRGMHLDVCRHYFDKAYIKQFLDMMARYKLNTFHWHLTEDQGWRIEVKKYPKLTEIGAWRINEDGTRYGGFYTQDDIVEIVAYARSRFITVVPEIEMPGHSVAALAAYPELSCTGGPFEVLNKWGVHKDVYCAGNEKVYTFLEDVLDEVIPLFPGEYVHVGGDECPKDRWKECPKCRAKIKAEGLKDEHELQSYFIRHFDAFLAERGKKLVGWDEILEGGLAQGATVMSWRGDAGGIAAAKMGRDVVMSPYTHLYFDYIQSNDPGELGARYRTAISLKRVYEYEPIPEELTAEQAEHVLGAQANVWTEPIETPQQVQYMTLPRITALAEVVWSDKAGVEWEAFERRVIDEYRSYDLMGVTYRDHRK